MFTEKLFFNSFTFPQAIDCDLEYEADSFRSPHKPISGSPARRRILSSTPNNSTVCSPPRTSRSSSRRDENSPPKKLRKGTQEVIGAVLEHMKKREEQDKKTADVLIKLTEAICGITEVLKNLTNKQFLFGNFYINFFFDLHFCYFFQFLCLYEFFLFFYFCNILCMQSI